MGEGLWTEAGCGHAHLDSGFAHAIESIAAGLGGRAFLDEVTKNGRCRKYGEVDVVKRLALLEKPL